MNDAEPIKCPDCAGRADRIGKIPATDQFAGRTLSHLLDGGYLYRCNDCFLGFKWPHLSKQQLDTLYAQGGDSTWRNAENTRWDWRIGHNWIRQGSQRGGRILDVGCFDGGFLEPLVAEYKCHGIEIHPVAAQRARDHGIEILGNDLSAISGSFDVVTAFDVIEHVERPGKFLEDCLAATNQHGFVIISSGNLDALSFRLMGARYWYCAIGEHIAFVSPRWFSNGRVSEQYTVLRQTSFTHGDGRWLQRMRDTGVNLAYRFAGAGFRALRMRGMGRKNVQVHPELADHPPGWLSAKDHIIVLIQKR